MRGNTESCNEGTGPALTPGVCWVWRGSGRGCPGQWVCAGYGADLGGAAGCVLGMGRIWEGLSRTLGVCWVWGGSGRGCWVCVGYGADLGGAWVLRDGMGRSTCWKRRLLQWEYAGSARWEVTVQEATMRGHDVNFETPALDTLQQSNTRTITTKWRDQTTALVPAQANCCCFMKKISQICVFDKGKSCSRHQKTNIWLRMGNFQTGHTQRFGIGRGKWPFLDEVQGQKLDALSPRSPLVTLAPPLYSLPSHPILRESLWMF